jgi:hypothetical protein
MRFKAALCLPHLSTADYRGFSMADFYCGCSAGDCGVFAGGSAPRASFICCIRVLTRIAHSFLASCGEPLLFCERSLSRHSFISVLCVACASIGAGAVALSSATARAPQITAALNHAEVANAFMTTSIPSAPMALHRRGESSACQPDPTPKDGARRPSAAATLRVPRSPHRRLIRSAFPAAWRMLPVTVPRDPDPPAW